jgi:putative membrane protein
MKRYLLLFLKGLGMGTVEVIPSISSSAIALLTGIYTDLLQAIHSLDKTAFQLLKNGQWRLLWVHIRGNFLLPLCAGIIVSLLSTVRLVRYLLVQYPIETWSFFLGISIISAIVIYQEIKRWTFLTWCYSCIGAFVAYLIMQINPVAMPHESWFLFLAGALAVCAMILPGISGSFVLLMLGQYTYMLEALQSFNWPVLGIFVFGGIIGLFSTSKLVLWLLRAYTGPTIALLAGFMLGSLPKTWPWKTSSLYSPDRSTHNLLIEQNVLPNQFQLLYKKDPHILQALLCICLGCLVVILLKKLGTRKDR